jgi:endonuclease/exonuclease/phosphatase family metal-dependent hydrolase
MASLAGIQKRMLTERAGLYTTKKRATSEWKELNQPLVKMGDYWTSAGTREYYKRHSSESHGNLLIDFGGKRLKIGRI